MDRHVGQVWSRWLPDAARQETVPRYPQEGLGHCSISMVWGLQCALWFGFVASAPRNLRALLLASRDRWTGKLREVAQLRRRHSCGDLNGRISVISRPSPYSTGYYA